MSVINGKIKDLYDNKGYGFLTAENDPNSYFFHREDFMGFWQDLVLDYRERVGPITVQFEGFETEKGPRAKNVRRIDWPNEG